MPAGERERERKRIDREREREGESDCKKVRESEGRQKGRAAARTE